MKEHARGFVIGSVLLMLAVPILYVGSEGVWYLATGESHFRAGSTYRTVYAPLDWAGDQWPKVYEGRQRLANGWLMLSGDASREAHVDRWWLPSPYYADGEWYFPPEYGFKPSREAGALEQFQFERELAQFGTERAVAAESTSSPEGIADAADD